MCIKKVNHLSNHKAAKDILAAITNNNLLFYLDKMTQNTSNQKYHQSSNDFMARLRDMGNFTCV